MTTWWWVRHGPTHERAFTGWRDVPADLSDTARVARLRAHLPHGATLVASDLQRAARTADAIAGSGLRLPDAPALREFNFGDWDGLTFDEVNRRDPQLSRQFWETPGDVRPPNGESWNELAERVGAFVDATSAQLRTRDIIAVAHIGVIMTQLERALGSASAAMAHPIEPLSVTCLRQEGSNWQLVSANLQP